MEVKVFLSCIVNETSSGHRKVPGKKHQRDPLSSSPLDSAQGTCLLSFFFQWLDAVELMSAIQGMYPGMVITTTVTNSLSQLSAQKRKASCRGEGRLAPKTMGWVRSVAFCIIKGWRLGAGAERPRQVGGQRWKTERRQDRAGKQAATLFSGSF